MFKRILILLAGVISVSLAQVGAEAQSLKVAVLELNNKAELTESESAYLTDLVRDAIIRMLPPGVFMIMTRESIQELLPPGVKVSDCSDAKCEVEIGRMVGADYIVSGEILIFDKKYRMNLKVHHCQSAAALGGEAARGDNLEGLEDSVRRTAGQLAVRIMDYSGTAFMGSDGQGKFTEGGGSESPEGEWTIGTVQKAVVHFESDPPGAIVLVDGRVMCTATPCSKELSEGPARVSMQKERYLASEKVVDIRKAEGELKISWILEPDFGWLTINSNPPGLKVDINNQGYGTTPVKDVELSPSGYRVKINDERYYAAWEDVLIERGNRREVTLLPKARVGGLLVSVADAAGNAVAAEVKVDGDRIGMTPCSKELIIGKHKVEIVSGRGIWEGEAEIKERTIDTLRVALRETDTPKANQKQVKLWDELGIKWVKVDGSTFQMGSADGETDEKPVHEVVLSDYWMSATEVTFDQYDAFCKATGRSKPKDNGWGRGNKPVINVSWYDAVAFCEWIGGRLSTEAEWEYAASGGNKSSGYKYSGSNKLSDVGWYDNNSRGKTHPVGEKQANELGLYDMSGNVWELCSDWYGAYDGGAQRNPVGPDSGEYRVIRGGSWGDSALLGRSANRNRFSPTARLYSVGFRVCRGTSIR